jgi:hypothetical protein
MKCPYRIDERTINKGVDGIVKQQYFPECIGEECPFYEKVIVCENVGETCNKVRIEMGLFKIKSCES